MYAFHFLRVSVGVEFTDLEPRRESVFYRPPGTTLRGTVFLRRVGYCQVVVNLETVAVVHEYAVSVYTPHRCSFRTREERPCHPGQA